MRVLVFRGWRFAAMSDDRTESRRRAQASGVQEDAAHVTKCAGRAAGRRIRAGAWGGAHPSAQALKVARSLVSSIVENNPAGILAQATERLREDTTHQWAIEFSDINAVDGRSWPEIERAIALSQRSGHWQTVILGPRKLRENWDAVNSL